MRIFYIFALLLFFNVADLFAQINKSYPFTLNGTSNADTGVVYLSLVADSTFYPKDLRHLTARIEHGKFSFNGMLPYPQEFTISLSGRYASGVFLIEAGQQLITYDIHRSGEIPVVNDMVMKEYAEVRDPAFAKTTRHRNYIIQKGDSLRKIYGYKLPADVDAELAAETKEQYKESDLTLYKYTREHPDSYISLWQLARLLNFGYESIFDDIVNSFSDSLKSTHVGKLLINKIKTSGVTATGKKFPDVDCRNVKNQKLKSASFSKNKYTLVDFWYSNCSPCRGQFPDLNNIYKKYKDKGLQIIGISTDKREHKKDWIAAIAHDQIQWPQYWDINGIGANKLSIEAFPTNFLLNSKNEIIQKDVNPAELEVFLAKNLE